MKNVVIHAPQGVSVSEFFEELVPPAVRELIARCPPQGMRDQIFRVRFSVVDIGDWLVSVTNGSKVHVQPDTATPAHLTVRFDESTFRRSQTGDTRRINVFQLLHGDRDRFERLLAVHGTLNVELQDDAERQRLSLIFNGADDPAVVLILAYNDFCDILDKQANTTMLLLRRRLRFSGDVGFLLRAKGLL